MRANIYNENLARCVVQSTNPGSITNRGLLTKVLKLGKALLLGSMLSDIQITETFLIALIIL